MIKTLNLKQKVLTPHSNFTLNYEKMEIKFYIILMIVMLFNIEAIAAFTLSSNILFSGIITNAFILSTQLVGVNENLAMLFGIKCRYHFGSDQHKKRKASVMEVCSVYSIKQCDIWNLKIQDKHDIIQLFIFHFSQLIL